MGVGGKKEKGVAIFGKLFEFLDILLVPYPRTKVLIHRRMRFPITKVSIFLQGQYLEGAP